MRIILGPKESRRYIRWHRSMPTKLQLVFIDLKDGHRTIGGSMSYPLQVDKKVPVNLTVADQYGNPTQFPAGTPIPVWTISDPNLCAIIVAADGMSAVLEPVGTLGSVTIHVVAGSLSGSADVNLLAGDPANLGMGFGTPVPK